MENSIQFLLLKPEDYNIYIEIGTKAYNQHYTHLWPDGDTTTYIKNSFTKEVLLHEEKDEDTTLYLIKLNSDYVGILKVTLHKQLQDYSKVDALYLDKIYILNEFSGQGVGSKTLKFVEQIATDHSKKAIFLESMQKGLALPFYLSHSFFIVANTQVPFNNVIEEEKPMYLLRKDV
ncbi:acetyltransferase (GNAT) family protein [Maribacter spongiicola]|uniref:Acetyltransferase (GNAT) family protein n=1 Tax=Maribacter spongiicola TaxID=1206753 RepID=A0A4R7K813_9FLAO|nr:GNAT family N-acetyltransferase [Maribacter spongiicola]TDT47447.1 acetyltransferase (GNAT) family protein [Maribacter spongiicola]